MLFRKVVWQRRKPLQNDADECDLLNSEKGVVCSPEPPPHYRMRNKTERLFIICGDTLAGFPRTLSEHWPSSCQKICVFQYDYYTRQSSNKRGINPPRLLKRYSLREVFKSRGNPAGTENSDCLYILGKPLKFKKNCRAKA